jgi:hypothetical protein
LEPLECLDALLLLVRLDATAFRTAMILSPCPAARGMANVSSIDGRSRMLGRTGTMTRSAIFAIAMLSASARAEMSIIAKEVCRLGCVTSDRHSAEDQRRPPPPVDHADALRSIGGGRPASCGPALLRNAVMSAFMRVTSSRVKRRYEHHAQWTKRAEARLTCRQRRARIARRHCRKSREGRRTTERSSNRKEGCRRQIAKLEAHSRMRATPLAKNRCAFGVNSEESETASMMLGEGARMSPVPSPRNSEGVERHQEDANVHLSLVNENAIG